VDSDIKAGTQKEEWFLRLNPNGRIPLLLDATQDPPFPVMESSAILLYLAEHYDKQAKFHFTSPLEKSELEQWLFFWHGSAQPYQGNFIYFSRILPEKCDIAIERFRKETLRVYEVLEIRLSGRYTSEPRDYLVGAGKGKYSIADISAFPWVMGATYSGFTEEEIAPFPHLAQWRERIVQRSAAQLGIDQEWHLK
jgi:glutathione S-transferase